MGLASQYGTPTGTYVAAWQASYDDAARVNGSAGDPKLSNGQLAALVRGWVRCAARSKTPTWPEAYEITIAALGYHATGDKFDMSAAHMNAPADADLLSWFWSASHDLAQRLDGDGTKPERLYVDWSAGGYAQAARDAWQQMQVERANGNAAAAPALSAPSTSGVNLGWLLLVLGVVLSKDKKRR